MDYCKFDKKTKSIGIPKFIKKISVEEEYQFVKFVIVKKITY